MYIQPYGPVTVHTQMVSIVDTVLYVHVYSVLHICTISEAVMTLIDFRSPDERCDVISHSEPTSTQTYTAIVLAVPIEYTSFIEP